MKFIVLFSGGLDSTVNLFEARKRGQVLMALTFDYGQRAADAEIRVTSEICKRTGIDHRIVDVRWFSEFTKSSLVNSRATVPLHVAIDDMRSSTDSAKAVWVPNRNGIFLNIAGGFAEGLGAETIVPGFNIEEAQTFPDNGSEFVEAATKSLFYSTANHVRVQAFTLELNKTEIVRRGIELGVDFNLIWPCYFGGEKPCGECESCLRYRRARRDA